MTISSVMHAISHLYFHLWHGWRHLKGHRCCRVYSCAEFFLLRLKKQKAGAEVWILLQITTFKNRRKYFITVLLNKTRDISDESCDNRRLLFLSYRSILLTFLLLYLCWKYSQKLGLRNSIVGTYRSRRNASPVSLLRVRRS
jgi:hypothetical protein